MKLKRRARLNRLTLNRKVRGFALLSHVNKHHFFSIVQSMFKPAKSLFQCIMSILCFVLVFAKKKLNPHGKKYQNDLMKQLNQHHEKFNRMINSMKELYGQKDVLGKSITRRSSGEE